MRAAVLVLTAMVPVLVVPSRADAGMHIDRRVERTTCGDLVRGSIHTVATAGGTGGSGEGWVDLDANPWALDHPVAYEREGSSRVAEERYRVGDGAVRVDVRLALEAQRFEVTVTPEPAGDFQVAVDQYLSGIDLPCSASGSLFIHETPTSYTASELENAVSVYRLLHEATELLYDVAFDAAQERLGRAADLAPESAVIQWQRARAMYLEGEALPFTDREGRVAAFRVAEGYADRAVELAPDLAEGWLWRAVARGRIATTQAAVRTVLDAVGRSRGPRWLADCFETAIRLGPTYEAFGSSALADALFGAAQLYRLLPAGSLVRLAIGVSRDLDRSVELLREAHRLQPLRIDYAKELGVALLCRGRESGSEPDLDGGRAMLELAGQLNARSPYDRVDHRHAVELLAAAPDAACGYSRDRWDGSATLAGG